MIIKKEEVKTLTSNSDDCEIYAIISDNTLQKFSIKVDSNNSATYTLLYTEKIEHLRAIRNAINDIFKELGLGGVG
jgi:hypothetical protein